MSKLPLSVRLYFHKPLYELARVVNYGGLVETAFWDRYKELCAVHGQEQMSAAVGQILLVDKTTTPAVVRLTPDARKWCFQLLGPAPEHPEYARYWSGRTPPAEHKPPKVPPLSTAPPPEPPPQPEAKPPEEPKAERTKEEDDQEETTPRPMTEGISPEGYARMAKEKNRRALMCMLRDARKKLAHHGQRSFSGKEACKEIDAAEAEIKNRGYTVPLEGEETKEWDRRKG